MTTRNIRNIGPRLREDTAAGYYAEFKRDQSFASHSIVQNNLCRNQGSFNLPANILRICLAMNGAMRGT
jgi:hypothetical protein